MPRKNVKYEIEEYYYEMGMCNAKSARAYVGGQDTVRLERPTTPLRRLRPLTRLAAHPVLPLLRFGTTEPAHPALLAVLEARRKAKSEARRPSWSMASCRSPSIRSRTHCPSRAISPWHMSRRDLAPDLGQRWEKNFPLKPRTLR